MSGLILRHHPPQHTDSNADLDTHTARRLMSLDAFAHHGLGGSGLAILAALAERDGQTLAELQGTASISRATAYRQLTTLTHLGLIQRQGELLHLTPKALTGTGQPGPHCQHPATDWTDVAKRLSVDGTGDRRRQHHHTERTQWHNKQLQLTARRSHTPPPQAHTGWATPTRPSTQGASKEPPHPIQPTGHGSGAGLGDRFGHAA
ncbi:MULTISPECIES: helix-turn-helix domain-containing protein [unclassified Streptomyces]|uniref:Helix-turn-helix domain-containing protein n=1 Tax=Streptomyces sp. NBC_00060 TaxID=2975636 RepID=A0AAU2HGI3_9ACTN